MSANRHRNKTLRLLFGAHIVGAGAVVAKNFLPGAIFYGIPATNRGYQPSPPATEKSSTP